jgi:sigma-54 dependent transcriptional regulator, acetoin dehydrogenase operon transcriptional activator AcoR
MREPLGTDLERLAALRTAVEEAGPGDAKAALEAALADALIGAGDYAEALVYLGSARRGVESQTLREHIELLVGRALLRRGDIERAEPPYERYLAAARARNDAAGEARALLGLGEVYRRRGETERAVLALSTAAAHFGRHPENDLLPRALVGQAVLALDAGDLDIAEQHAVRALELASDQDQPGARSRALMVIAQSKHLRGDLAGAERACRQAIVVAEDAGLKRETAEGYFEYAHIVGESGAELTPPVRETPASFIARAQELYREHGSLGDLERVREAFRRYGRRATDHIATNEVKAMLDDLRASRLQVAREAHRLVDTVDAFVGRADSELPQSLRARLHNLTTAAGEAERAVAQSVETMSAAEGRVLTATQAIISERENIRTLLDLCRSLNEISDIGMLVSETCRMAAQLTGADRSLVALTTADGRLEVQAAHHMPELSSETAWRAALDSVLEGRGPMLIEDGAAPARRGEDLRLGTALVTPLRQGDTVLGAVYCDKDLCGGLFTPHDLDLLSVFCSQAATTLANVRASEQIRLAARARAVTLEAISDGVLALDRSGSVTWLNAVAARLLGVSPQAPLDLRTLPDLGFLRAVLERGDSLESRVTRVGPGEVLVSAHVVKDDKGEVATVVVSLAEMKRVQSLAQRIAGSHARYSFGDIVGQSQALRRRLQLAEAAARSDSSVLITGESGTGKEVIAQAIHNASARATGPFVGINCSAIPRELLESELFGYEGGAFTGARKGGQPGKFELAEGGTILLDEIGDMPLEMQSKLLRVLQERRVHRIGGVREVPLDARVIATTNSELEEAVARGRFRSDLLFRLKVIHIPLPPLRERREDVPILVDHYLGLFAARLGKKVRSLAPHVMEAFVRYPWPGNIRELEHALEAEVNLAANDQTQLDQIPDSLGPRTTPVHGVPTIKLDTSLTIDEAEKELLVQALTRHGGSIPDVAKTLGVSRGTVYNKLRRYALDASQFRRA